ncbi:MAG TPA: methyl-accepting chemotaxis protein, partial [Verrucomicrobiae bacterium]|nr:methyl-accepting chemotaxis protein [Verrucomicrobiae bacterium]
MAKKLSFKIVGVLILVMVVIMSVFTFFLVRSQTKAMNEEMLVRAQIEAKSGARLMERVLAEGVANGALKVDALFDQNYEPIAGTDPPKYHTRYDRYLDGIIQRLEDEYLQDPQVVFAVLVDKNGYLPTHNTKYSQPLTGDREKDRSGNRGKRLFNDQVGLAAARNSSGVLKQVYNRDTGEQMWDLSAPVFVDGRHWGAFRIGFSMEKTEKMVAALRWKIIGAMAMLLIVSSVTILVVVTLLIRPL